jgi:hypothetical protein
MFLSYFQIRIIVNFKLNMWAMNVCIFYLIYLLWRFVIYIISPHITHSLVIKTLFNCVLYGLHDAWYGICACKG